MRDLFRYCPRCGVNTVQWTAENLLTCPSCDLHLYRNATVAVGAIILNSDSKVLLIRRAKEPAKGKLAVPGGFIDIGETAEQALQRELHEEVGLELASATYLTSHPNNYSYRGVTYPVLDLFFVCTIREGTAVLQQGEVESMHWYRPDEFGADDLAFPSMQHAWRFHLARRE